MIRKYFARSGAFETSIPDQAIPEISGNANSVEYDNAGRFARLIEQGAFQR